MCKFNPRAWIGYYKSPYNSILSSHRSHTTNSLSLESLIDQSIFHRDIILETINNAMFSALIYCHVNTSHFLPLRLAVKRARVFAVSVLLAPCGVLGAPNDGAGVEDANAVPMVPVDPGLKLKPPLGMDGAGMATGAEITKKKMRVKQPHRQRNRTDGTMNQTEKFSLKYDGVTNVPGCNKMHGSSLQLHHEEHIFPVFYHLVVSELIPYGQYTARVDLLVPCTDVCPKPLNELLPPVPN